MRTLSHWTMILLSLILILPAVVLEGCGGGGSGASAASAVTTTAPGSNGAAGTVASTGTESPNPQSTGTPTPTPGGTPTGTPTATPTGAAGTHSLSGKITDEQGNGLASVALKAQEVSPPKRVAGKLIYTPTASDPLSTETGADGTYNLDGLGSDQYYSLTIYRYDRKTLRTVFKFDPTSSDQSILLIAPRGTGIVQFQLPSQRTLTVSGVSTDAVATWDTSNNAGFSSYTMFRGAAPNMGLAATEVSTLQSPTDLSYTDTWYTDHKITAPPLTYYRLYEKVFLPELGNFVLMGSNEVGITFPQVSVSPTNLTTEIPTGTTLQFQFSVPMNQATVERALTVTSRSDKDEVVSGRCSWVGNTMTFTPGAPLKLARLITARVSGATDATGSILADSTTTFTVTSGYVSTPGWYRATLPNAMHNIGCDPNGVVAFACTAPDGTITLQGLAKTQGIGASDAVWIGGGTNAVLDFMDAVGNFWVYHVGIAVGFSSQQYATGTSLGSPDFIAGRAQAVDWNWPRPTIHGNVSINSKTITGVSEADLQNVVTGEPIMIWGMSGERHVTAIDTLNGTITLDLAATSSGTQLALNLGPEVVTYALTSTPNSIGAPWNLDTGALQVQAANGFRPQPQSPVQFYLHPTAPYSNYLVPPGAKGTSTGQYSNPSSVTTDVSGNIYIADNDNGRVVVYDRTSIWLHGGAPPYPGYIGTIGSAGTGGYGRFGAGRMGQVVVDNNNYIYVVDGGNGLIQKFAGLGVTGHAFGDFITQFAYGGTTGTGVGTPMCVDPMTGNIYSIANNPATLTNTSITRTTLNPNP